METMISSLQEQRWISVTHASDIAAARRACQRMAQTLNFDETRSGRLAIIVTEAATNMLKHAGDGRLYLSQVRSGDNVGIEVLALDRGPGIANLAQALQDGVSSTGTAGIGLGALRRLSDEFDIYAPARRGTVCTMRIWNSAPSSQLPHAGALCLPLAGEEESGDGVALLLLRRGATLVVVDGLGHGPEAAKAAAAALCTIELQPTLQPAMQIEACHAALRPTRGAALAIVQVDASADVAHFAGIGNISACIIDGQQRRQMLSHNGIVGHNMRKVQEFSHPCPPGALIILHSDGINTQWDLQQYPGLIQCHAALIAAVLLRDFARGRDDASVIVMRHTATEERLW
jgi:anti-sigma regulatory factor (Ser/Thr protein kinase)